MVMIINPGSGPVQAAGDGWSNTRQGAEQRARDWLKGMHTDGLTDVELLPGVAERDGRWVFTYRHKVTGVTVDLETHGIPDAEIRAYEKDRIFMPRIYWNGSSTADPALEDFAAPGFEPIKSYRAATEEGADR